MVGCLVPIKLSDLRGYSTVGDLHPAALPLILSGIWSYRICFYLLLKVKLPSFRAGTMSTARDFGFLSSVRARRTSVVGYGDPPGGGGG